MTFNVSIQNKLIALIVALSIFAAIAMSLSLAITSTTQEHKAKHKTIEERIHAARHASLHFDRMIYWFNQMAVVQSDRAVDKANAEKDKLTQYLSTIQEFAPSDVENINATIPSIQEHYLNALNLLFDGDLNQGRDVLKQSEPMVVEITKTLDKLNRRIASQAPTMHQEYVEDINQYAYIAFYCLLVALVIATATLLVIKMNLIMPVKKLIQVMQEIIKGTYTDSIPYQLREDEIGEISECVVGFKDFVDSGISLQSALDATASNIIMLDNDHNISYLNQSAIQMMKDTASDLKKVIPDLEINTLIGKPISYLCTMDDITNKGFKGNIEIGDLTFHLKTHIVCDRMDQQLSIISEWKNITQELSEAEAIRTLEEDISTIITSTHKGNFSKRLNTNNSEGFLLTLRHDINSISDVVEKGLGENIDIMQKMAQGDVSQMVEGVQHGAFNDLKLSINQTIGQLRHLVHEANNTKNALQNGQFDYHINTSKQNGFALEVMKVMNSMTDASHKGFSDISQALGTLSEGNLAAGMTHEYQGLCADVKAYFNDLVSQLSFSSQEIEHAVQLMQSGQFSYVINNDDTNGFLHTLHSEINNTSKHIDLKMNYLANALNEMNDGIFKPQINQSYQGTFLKLHVGMNTVNKTLQNFTTEILDHTNQLKKGEFASYMTIQDKQGSFLEITKNLNASSKVTYESLDQMNASLMQLSHGNIKSRITGHYTGQFNDTKQHVNRIIQQLDNLIIELQQSHHSVDQGGFNVTIPVQDKEGFFLNMSKNINAIVATSLEGLHEIETVLQSLSKGVLNVEMTGTYKGHFHEIQTMLNATILRLREMVVQIFETSHYLIHATNDISDGTLDLSVRTEQQVTRLKDTNSSTKQLATTVTNNSKSVQEADKKTDETRKIATKAEQTINDAIKAMGQIQQSSDKVARIISVIDDVAFQTNLIAMSASVELEQAGDVGKGFAVIADEIRVLACQSAAASKEIRNLVNQSSQHLEQGSTLVQGSSKTVKDIIDSVNSVTELINSIAAENKTQSAGLDTMSQSIKEIDQTTKQNTALISQNNTATKVMREQADTLIHMTQLFSLEEH